MISEKRNKGKNNPFYGKKHTKETRLKMSLASKGKKKSEEHRKNIAKVTFGEKNPSWKGNKVGYRALHHWVERNIGKVNYCEHCGLDKKPENKKRYFQWANKSHKYLRELTDWIRLCLKCHKKYDRK